MSLTTARHAGAELALSPRTLRRYANEGHLRPGRHFLRIGRTLRFDLAAIRADLAVAPIERKNRKAERFERILGEVGI